jgi:hypothetical protein
LADNIEYHEVAMTKYFIIGLLALQLAACSNKTPDLKSPCVGGKESPCDRRPANQA